jgi:hypothetical protein
MIEPLFSARFFAFRFLFRSSGLQVAKPAALDALSLYPDPFPRRSNMRIRLCAKANQSATMPIAIWKPMGYAGL